MKPLPLRPLPMPGEALSDYLERLAYANGYKGYELWDFLDRGEYSHEQMLSFALNGHVFPAFAGPAVRHVNIPVKSFGLQATDFTFMYRRWCPHCIENSAWLRVIWRIEVTTVCDIHRVQLLEECPACHKWATIQEIFRGTCECGVRFTSVVVPTTRKLVQLAHVLAASLEDSAALTLKNLKIVLTTAQLVRMIHYTGRLMDGPQLKRPGQIEGLDKISVASRFVDGTATLLADWPHAFWHCLEQYLEAAPDDLSVQRVFAPLYHVIYQDLRDPAFQFWRDAFELFLRNNWHGEVCGRHRLFKEETIQAFPNRGLARVARMTGVGRQTLKRMVHNGYLQGNSFTGPSKREFITIDCTQLSHFIPDPADYLDMRSAARHLGIKRTRLRHLVAAEVILADAQPDWTRSRQWRFRRSEIVGFMEQIKQSALPELSYAVTTVTLRHTLRHWRVTDTELGAILVAMRRGKIAFTLAEQGRLRDATFDECALHDWLERYRESTIGSVSVPTAAKLLGLKQEVVYGLIEKGLLAAELIVKREVPFTRILLSNLERFRQEYVSLVQLAKQQQTSPTALMNRLNAQPITGPKIDGKRQYFFKRDDLQGDILSGRLADGVAPDQVERQEKRA